MSVVNSDSMRAGAAGAVSAAYTIENSCRFNDDDTPYLKKSGIAGNRDVWTFSTWFKAANIFSNGADGPHIWMASGSDVGAEGSYSRLTLGGYVKVSSSGSAGEAAISNNLIRDPGAWYHIVWKMDTGNSIHNVYINGVEISYSSKSNPSTNSDTLFNSSSNYERISLFITGEPRCIDGYLAETIFIDSAALNPTSFGEFNSDGVWVPIDPSGLTFGAAGFWLDYAIAPGTGFGAGNDVSGNNNDFTEVNLAANDQMSDSPTDDAENDVGNYCTWNPLVKNGGAYKDGNLEFTGVGDSGVSGTISYTSGKWQHECTLGATSFYCMFGVAINPISYTSLGSGASRVTDNNAYVYEYDGQVSYPGTLNVAFGSTLASGDRVTMYHDADNGNAWFAINGTLQGGATFSEISAGTTTNAAFTGMPTGASNPYAPYGVLLNTPTSHILNCGQSSLVDTTPTGYKGLCTANLAAPAITDPSKYFQVDTFTGTGSELVRTLTDAEGGAVKPDLVWIKDRDTAIHNVITDSARGATKETFTHEDNAAAESTATEGVKSFDTSGYTLGTDTDYNASSSLNVAWCWVTEGGAGSSNTEGSINTTTTSVGLIPGLSISTFTGTGANATYGHGLDTAPEFVLQLPRSNEGPDNASNLHTAFGSPGTHSTITNLTPVADSGLWNNNTDPTATLVHLGARNENNGSSRTYVNYCWHGVEGFSKFGSFEGNGADDNVFVWLGFSPALLWIKSQDSTSPWLAFDNRRLGYNVDNNALALDTNAAELTTDMVDLLSNGFKVRDSTDPGVAETYVYCAWAAFPFGGDGVSQARAR